MTGDIEKRKAGSSSQDFLKEQGRVEDSTEQTVTYAQPSRQPYIYEPEETKFQRPVRDVLHFIFLNAFFITLFAIVMASLSPPNAIKPYIRYSDKVLHFSAYFGISFLALGAFPKTHLVLIFFGLSLAGASVEILQVSMGLGRTASLGDIAANCMGAAVPILLWFAFRLLLPSKQK